MNYTNNYLISGTKSGIIEIYDETTLTPINTKKSFDDRTGVISPYISKYIFMWISRYDNSNI